MRKSACLRHARSAMMPEFYILRRYTVRRSLAVGLAMLAMAAAVPAQEVGSAAPDFSIDSWLNGTGEKALSQFVGKVVLVEFWSKG